MINSAFSQVENLADHVYLGNFDLLSPDKEIIMKEYWDDTIEPEMHITMTLWPLPEKQEAADPIPSSGEDGILNLDDILNPGGGRRGRKTSSNSSTVGTKSRKPTSKGSGGLGIWMLGGVPKKKHAAAKWGF